jgi:lipopolysaccharide biosynthesis protein
MSQAEPMADAGSRRARVIAFYLPQYHPIPENDEWWGTGFTEWRNAAKARPLFRDHYQPHVPADLGFYDLRVPETRLAQANMAREYGVEAFCYFHYWFGGRRILERPFNEVLSSGQPDFPFCLCWANQTWTGVWHGAENRILVEQTYPGLDDYLAHFDYLINAFRDPRYVRVDGKPLFIIYQPEELPDARAVTDLWRQLAVKAGLPGLFLVAEHPEPAWKPAALGFDAKVAVRLPPRRRKWTPWNSPGKKIRNKMLDLLGRPSVIDYAAAAKNMVLPATPGMETYPCVMPNWDNTPRSGKKGLVFTNSTPALFGSLVETALSTLEPLPADRRLLFVKAWNEWGEGNHLEPDLKFGHQYLEVLKARVQQAPVAGLRR